MAHQLNERERRVLEAVIQSYVETAEPAGSRMIARRFGLGVSPATIRNTMSDLEEKGFLLHPHTSAGRIPTDMAYRVYVDSLMRVTPINDIERGRLFEELSGTGTAIEAILRRAAQVLGILTQELGVALGPRLEEATLHNLELIRMSAERLLMVMRSTAAQRRACSSKCRARSPRRCWPRCRACSTSVSSGLTLGEIRRDLATRLRDSGAAQDVSELLNIFLQEGDQIFDALRPLSTSPVLLGQASLLAEQPEFSSGGNLQEAARAHGSSRGARRSCCARTRAPRASRSRSATSTSIRTFPTSPS